MSKDFQGHETDLDINRVLASSVLSKITGSTYGYTDISVAKNRLGNLYIEPTGDASTDEDIAALLLAGAKIENSLGEFIVEGYEELYLGDVFKCWLCSPLSK